MIQVLIMAPLTNNAVQSLVSANAPDGVHYIVQVINVRQINQERYRVIISDGEHYVHAMMASQLNHLIMNNQISENTVIKVKENITNMVQDKIVVILLSLDVLYQEQSRIGQPVEYKASKDNNKAQPQAQSLYKQNQNIHNPSVTNSYNHSNQNSSPVKSNPYNAPKQNTYKRPTSYNQPIVQSGMSSSNFTPISALNMYQNRWTIKARVTSKNPIKEWNNARGQGKLFSIALLDSSETDIRATFFKEAVDAFYNLLEVGGVYTFSGGRLKVANAQWNTCKSNFEVTFDDKANIQKVQDEGNIKEQSFEFVKIDQLEQMDPGTNVDILAVVKTVGVPGTIMSKKSGQELNKCDVTLLDDSGVEISLTLWGEKAVSADREYAGQPIVAFKSLRLGDYGGRSLSSSFNASMTKEPRNLPEVMQLKSWWQRTGGSVSKSLSTGGGSRGDSFENRKYISSIKDEQLGYQEKPDWISIKSTVNFIKKDKEGGPWYTACPNAGEPCKNRFKVTQTTDGNYHCDRCNQTFNHCVRRFIFSATITDDTSTTWVSFFDEQARQLLGEEHTADDINKKCFENYDQDLFDSIFNKAQFTDWIIKCKVKQEMVGDENRVKSSVYTLTKMDYVSESRNLLSAIEAL